MAVLLQSPLATGSTAAWAANQDVAAGSVETDATNGTNSQATKVTTGTATDADSGDNVVSTGSSTSASGANSSGDLRVETGASTAAGNAGGTSGTLIVQTGDTAAAALAGGASGSLTLKSGDTTAPGAGAGGASGALLIQSGDCTGAGAGLSGSSGSLTIETGTSSEANSGSILIQTGVPTAAGASGDITLAPGDLTGAGTAGSVILAPGATVGGNDGAVRILDALTPTMAISFDPSEQAPNGTTVLPACAIEQLNTFAIPVADVRTLNSIPVPVTPPAPVGYYPEFVSATLWYDYDTAAFGGIATGEDLVFTMGPGGPVVSGTVEATGMLDQANDEVRHVNAISAADYIPTDNTSIFLALTAGDITAGGASVLQIKVLYRNRSTTW